MTGSKKPHKHRGPRWTDASRARNYYNGRDQAMQAQRVNLEATRSDIRKIIDELDAQRGDLVKREQALLKKAQMMCRFCTQQQKTSCQCQPGSRGVSTTESPDGNEEAAGYLGGEAFTLVGGDSDGDEYEHEVLSTGSGLPADRRNAGTNASQSNTGDGVQGNEAVSNTDTPGDATPQPTRGTSHIVASERRSRGWFPTLF